MIKVDLDALRYESLTSTNSAKFDESALVPAEAIYFKIALQCIETILRKKLLTNTIVQCTYQVMMALLT